jgi:aryl-alcohol dehydrogenase-like predicted oxidoreductase
MELTTLGKTGLRPTRIGLGSGGFSKLGMGQQKGDSNAMQVVRAALDAGVNFIDTAEGYGTEAAVGEVIRHYERSQLILSTKLSYKADGRIKTPAEIEASLRASLQRLHTSYVDIYHVHGVNAADYPAVMEHVLPTLQRMQTLGLLRFIGITEVFASDTAHRALTLAVQDDCWDVMMVGFNLLNHTARERVLRATQAKGIGTLCMFAVRQALISVDRLDAYLQQQTRERGVDARVLEAVSVLRELIAAGECASVTEAAYRYCRHEPGLDCILVGTGSVEHLRQNVVDALKPPLPHKAVTRIESLFDGVDALSGQ